MGSTHLKAILIACALGLIGSHHGAEAAQKQGGGAFGTNAGTSKPAVRKKSVPKKRTVKRNSRKTPTDRKPVVQNINYNGNYKGRFALVSKNTDQPCWSGSRDVQIRNNRVALQVVPLIGDTLGGQVQGGTIRITTLKKAPSLNPWKWSGSIQVPTAKGQVGVGRLSGKDGAGRGCEWRLELVRK